jgi:hypothetical protein
MRWAQLVSELSPHDLCVCVSAQACMRHASMQALSSSMRPHASCTRMPCRPAAHLVAARGVPSERVHAVPQAQGRGRCGEEGESRARRERGGRDQRPGGGGQQARGLTQHGRLIPWAPQRVQCALRAEG